MFRHVVMFRWRDDADPGAVRTALRELDQLPERLDVVRAFTVGTDAGLAEQNHDVVVVADFDDHEAYLTYRDHPAHQELSREHLGPLIAERAAVQHQLT